jgi:phage FluMu gp28-like protein
LVDHLDLVEATGVAGAVWEPFQIAHLDDDSKFRIERKSRQIAWSFTSAAEAVAEAILSRQDSIFVSINLEEAAEKIRYARQIYESLKIAGLPKIVGNSKLKLELSNGARLQSLPARPPRGRARATVYLDEFAHVRDDRPIYTAALPVTSKGGRIRIGSSTAGASGQFWEIDTQAIRGYPGYSRAFTPWHRANAFCVDPAAAEIASRQLDAEQLVRRYGRQRIVEIFDNMILEDFLQEYCGAYVDAAAAWITWQQIKDAQDPDHLWIAATARARNVEPALVALREAQELYKAGRLERTLTAGLDIGRTRNASELYIVGETTTGDLPLRVAITMENVDFSDQEAIIALALRLLPISRLLIDRNGIGRNLAENLSKQYPGKAVGVDFTNPLKRLWATDAKMLIERRKTPIPVDRDLAYQIHSIRRIPTGSGAIRFDTETNEKHHADKFWSWSLAIHAGYRSAMERDARRAQPGQARIPSV